MPLGCWSPCFSFALWDFSTKSRLSVALMKSSLSTETWLCQVLVLKFLFGV
jgi:hypothetical protein